MLRTHSEKNWIHQLTRITATIAWVLANGLDIFSMALFLQQGRQLAFVGLTARHHPAELALLYAGMRTLGTLAMILVIVLVEKRWAPRSQVPWSILTAGSLATATVAWLRIY